MSAVTFPRESAESLQTGGPLHLVLNPGLVEPKDLVDDVVEDALLAPPVPGHDDVLLLLASAEDAHVEVTWEAVVPLVVLTLFRVATIDFGVTRKFNILEAGIIPNKMISILSIFYFIKPQSHSSSAFGTIKLLFTRFGFQEAKIIMHTRESKIFRLFSLLLN